MKKLIFLLILFFTGIITYSQSTRVMESNLTLKKTSPTFYLQGSGANINFNNDLSFTQSSNRLTLSGGNLDLGSNNLYTTGQIGTLLSPASTIFTGILYSANLYGIAGLSTIGETGNRFLKAWFTDLDITNLPTINGGTLKSGLGVTTLGNSFLTIVDVTDIRFPRINANNSVSALTAADMKTALGVTYVGNSFFTLTNPSAITFPRINADNTVTALSAANFKTAIAIGQSDVTALADSLLNRYTKTQSNNIISARIQDSIQRNAIFNQDYYITKISSTVYAIPHPKRSTYVSYSGATLTPVLQSVFDDLEDIDYQKIYIADGLYDGMDSVIWRGDHLSIEGAGQYKTILKLRDAFDADISKNYGLLQIRNEDKSYHSGNSISNLTLNGNRSNQTKFSLGGDDPGDPAGITNGILIYRNYNFVIENVHVVGFYNDGIETLESPDATILNCRVDSIGWNGITINQKSVRNRVEGCYVTHCGDVGIDVQASNSIIHNNRLREMDGLNGSGNTRAAIALENYPKNVIISNNIIQGGDSTLSGITSNARTPGSATNAIITGNNIDSCAIGIGMASDSSYISNNIITAFNTRSFWADGVITSSTGVGIQIVGGDYNTVSGNLIRSTFPNLYGIRLHYSGSYYADYNNVINNVIFNDASLPGIVVSHANCTYNVIANNISNGEYGNDVDDQWIVYNPALSPTSMIYNNLNRAGSTRAPDQVARNFKITAAADTSHANSKIDPGSQFITVTSSSANNCVRLPKALLYTIGTKIEGTVGANGFELRVPNSQLSTVYINGVTTNTEAAIPANSSFEVIQIDSTHWILRAWDALGAIITAIVPDAI